MGKVRSKLKTRRRTYIREWRKFRNLTLERMAERIGVTAGALSQLERGDVAYTQPMLEALAEALGCEPSDLITRDPHTNLELQLVWDAISKQDRHRAMLVLEAFTKKDGTNG